MKEENAQRSTLNAQHSTPSGFETDPKFDLEERLLDYAARIIRLSDTLPQTRAGNHVAGQLLRSGTSALPNHGEAQAAESIDDFIHKMRICHKELREARRWLRLCHRVPLLKKPPALEPLIDETVELIRIFALSIKTALAREGSRRKSIAAR
jgi:four helix bundle protein